MLAVLLFQNYASFLNAINYNLMPAHIQQLTAAGRGCGSCPSLTRSSRARAVHWEGSKQAWRKMVKMAEGLKLYEVRWPRKHCLQVCGLSWIHGFIRLIMF